MHRKFIFDTLTSVASLKAVKQGESMLTAKQEPPFAVYRMGNDTNEGLWDDYSDNPDIGRQFFQIYLHDKPADYAGIDDLVVEVKTAFKEAALPPGIVAIRYLETSRDLDDSTLKTIYRYLRFQLVRAG